MDVTKQHLVELLNAEIEKVKNDEYSEEEMNDMIDYFNKVLDPEMAKNLIVGWTIRNIVN